MPLTITRAQLLALDPCDTQAARAIDLLWPGDDHPATAREAVDAGITLDDLVWVAVALASSSPDVERRLRLWMADCAARVAPIYERAYPHDDRVRGAIVAARLYARGEIDAAAARAARAAAEDAARAAEDAAWAAARAAAWAAARAAAMAAGDATEDAAWAAWAARAAAMAAGAATEDAAWAAWAAGDATEDAARDAEEAWQLQRLVLWLSDEEPADWPLI